MAGALKREAVDTAEELTLMRALRDMNMPKFGNSNFHYNINKKNYSKL